MSLRSRILCVLWAPFWGVNFGEADCFSMNLEIVWWYLCSDVNGNSKIMLYDTYSEPHHFPLVLKFSMLILAQDREDIIRSPVMRNLSSFSSASQSFSLNDAD